MSDVPEPPATDSPAAFAADLRRLRLAADSPTFARLQEKTGISRTVLSEALAGRALPSARTVDHFVRACGKDPTSWVARRDVLASGEGVAAGRESVTAAPRPGVGHRAVAAIASGAFLLGMGSAAGIGAVIAGGMVSDDALRAAPSPTVGVRIDVDSGLDPALTTCLDDAAVAAGETRDDAMIEIIFSSTCQAGWGRITRYDGQAEGNTVTVNTYLEIAPDGPSRQTATDPAQSVYTTLLVRPTPDTRLCVDGSYSVDGEQIPVERICL